jgi:hypothetical protein
MQAFPASYRAAIPADILLTNHTSTVSHEASPPSDLVEHRIDTQTHRRRVHPQRSCQSFTSSQQSTNGESREVRCTCTIAKVVTPSSTGQSSPGSLERVGRGVHNVQVLYIVPSQPGKRVKPSGVKFWRGEEAGSGRCVGRIVGRSRGGRLGELSSVEVGRRRGG